MKENFSGRKNANTLNITNEEISNDDDSSFQSELKTPTG